MPRSATDLTDGKIVKKLSKMGSRWTPLRPTNRRHYGSVVWKCVCACGKKASKTSDMLLSGRSKSCGCLRTEQVKENFEKKDRNDKVFSLVSKKGWSHAEVAKKFKITRARVYQIFHKVQHDREQARAQRG